MSGITACPQCQTRFRVTTEQLQARSGEVRCGRCSHIFNAYQTWEEEAPEPIAEISRASATDETQLEATLLLRPGEVSTVHPELVEGFAGLRQAQPARNSRLHRAGAIVGTGRESVPADIPPAEVQPEALATPEPFEIGESPDSSGLEETLEIKLEPEAPFCAMPEPDAELEPEVRVVRVQPSAERVQPRVSPSMPKYAPPPKPKPVWPLLVLNLMLVMVLFAQGAYFYRDLIVAHYPLTKPLMESACESVQCRIGLLKNLDLLGIESSDLHSDLDHPSLVTLSSVLRNRASYIQAFPSLELTLTNARDEVLVRRLFAPEEYLPSAANIGQGIAAKGEVTVKLLMDMGEIKADGYRLYLL
ncbi:MAG: DUF3426 domain-containing protein [Sulfuricellaceae bacterium]|nr:DUF3426 domain-containing protein [Sulfuricellaceae bacterium]